MEMVSGLDLHRSQITFRTVDLRTGEVKRGRIYPGAREAVREWLERFEAGTEAHFALEGTTGWRFVAGILLPAAFPYILSGLKIGWAFAWRTIIAVTYGGRGTGTA